MPLAEELRDLADRVLRDLGETRNYYLRTRRAWRVVHEIAAEGRAVGIIDEASGKELAPADLKSIAQDYVAIHLTESVFKTLTSLLEDWILGLARVWLSAYPIQLDRAYNDVADRSRSQRRDEIQVPLSEILAAQDRESIIEGVVERVVRELAYRRPEQWFRFLENR